MKEQIKELWFFGDFACLLLPWNDLDGLSFICPRPFIVLQVFAKNTTLTCRFEIFSSTHFLNFHPWLKRTLQIFFLTMSLLLLRLVFVFVSVSFIHTCIYGCMCLFINAYIHLYTHTHTYIGLNSKFELPHPGDCEEVNYRMCLNSAESECLFFSPRVRSSPIEDSTISTFN